MLTLVKSTSETIQKLLSTEHDWNELIVQLLAHARERGKMRGMESHHVEPAREEIVQLWPLEHLAIHICEAMLFPSDSTHAKVAAFVRPFPGNYRRIIPLPDDIHNLVLSFGQRRPSKTVEEMTRISNLPQSKLAQQANGRRMGAENGKKSAEKVSVALKGRKITWGEKISSAILARGEIICDKCGKRMKDIPANLVQHQRSSKCKQ